MADARYYDGWSDWEALRATYPDVPPDAQVVYAGYTYEDYSGSAIVVFVENGKLFENHDGHCSCNGLESWSPEETSVKAVLMRPPSDWPGLHEALIDWCAGRVAGRVVAPVTVPDGKRAIFVRH